MRGEMADQVGAERVCAMLRCKGAIAALSSKILMMMFRDRQKIASDASERYVQGIRLFFGRLWCELPRPLGRTRVGNKSLRKNW